MGIKPIKVARANLLRGTLRMGEAMLINQLGSKGVTLKKSR